MLEKLNNMSCEWDGLSGWLETEKTHAGAFFQSGYAFSYHYNNALDDTFGIVHLSGDNNSVIGNNISESLNTPFITPPGTKPVIIHVVAG
ncbi:hypothetical protein C6560_17430 [Enterobacter sp. FS01]|nr:hypothetical protein C6560_17430 [Enterobacter sp. FS01]